MNLAKHKSVFHDWCFVLFDCWCIVPFLRTILAYNYWSIRSIHLQQRWSAQSQYKDIKIDRILHTVTVNFSSFKFHNNSAFNWCCICWSEDWDHVSIYQYQDNEETVSQEQGIAKWTDEFFFFWIDILQLIFDLLKAQLFSFCVMCSSFISHTGMYK